MKSIRKGASWCLLAGAMLLGLLSTASAQNQTFDQAITGEQAQRQKAQPGNNSPVWREVRSEKEHYTTDKGREAGVLVQAGGETWRRLRNSQVIPISGWIFTGVLALIAAFYFFKGTVKLHSKPTGRTVQRFSTFERMTHWTVAGSFVLLAISGLVMAFGKWILLPIIGHTLFAWLTILLKNVHNFVGPLFSVALIVLFFTFIKDNWPKGYDLQWLLKGGGLLNGEHVPSGKFNMGEKVWFWGGVLVLGTAVTITGFVLNELVPGMAYTRATMQQMNILHLIFAMVFMTLFLGHAYMGTLGMEGAFNAMKTGYVDEVWAKEHHEYWYNDVKAAAHAPAAGGALAATAAQAKHDA